MLFYAILLNSDISHIVTKYRDKSDIVGQIGHPQRGFGQNGHFGNVESAMYIIGTYTRISDQTSLNRTFYP